MDEIILEILGVSTGNDYMIFHAGKSEPIALHRKYHGVSTQITGYIKNIRVPFNVDIGVGDIIIPKAEKRRIQTQLEGYEKPEIMTYSLESTIAEKFDAILQRFELTGRMKDFYDIYYLANTFEFDDRKLQEALIQTLQNRGTAYEKDSFERVLLLADNSDMQVKWNYFLKTIHNKELLFLDVIEKIEQFIKPVYAAILEENEFFKSWNPTDYEWIVKMIDIGKNNGTYKEIDVKFPDPGVQRGSKSILMLISIIILSQRKMNQGQLVKILPGGFVEYLNKGKLQ